MYLFQQLIVVRVDASINLPVLTTMETSMREFTTWDLKTIHSLTAGNSIEELNGRAFRGLKKGEFYLNQRFALTKYLHWWGFCDFNKSFNGQVWIFKMKTSTTMIWNSFYFFDLRWVRSRRNEDWTGPKAVPCRLASHWENEFFLRWKHHYIKTHPDRFLTIW